MQTETKTDKRQPSVNGKMFQFLHVKIVAIIFVKDFLCQMFFMLIFVAQQLAYSQICSRN